MFNYRTSALFFIFPLASLFSSPFEELMGKGTSSWQYVETLEDLAHLRFYEALYQKNQQTHARVNSIPKTIHFIWLGLDPLPESSIRNIHCWISQHPGWKIKFWTDIDRPVPCDGMERCLVREFSFSYLGDCFLAADNVGEKSLLLRYEILFQEGGLYVDHDVKLLRAFDAIHSSYDFYGSLETLARPVLSSSIYPAVHLIASKPHHPVLRATLERLQAHWGAMESYYPGTDAASLINRVQHRSVSALDAGVHVQINREGNRDILFPAGEFCKYATHLHAGLWYQDKTELDRKLESHIEKLSSQLKKNTCLTYILSSFSLLALLILAIRFKSFRRAV